MLVPAPVSGSVGASKPSPLPALSGSALISSPNPPTGPKASEEVIGFGGSGTVNSSAFVIVDTGSAFFVSVCFGLDAGLSSDAGLQIYLYQDFP